jgi:zinc-binding in reverse transcriptase
MQWKAAIAPRDKGGLNMPDIRSRLEAIQTMWLKKWLAPEEKRPLWASIMDEILKKNVAKNPVVHPKATMSWALQSWHESESKDAKISSGIRCLLKTARKFNLEFVARRMSIETKKKLPFWHNIEVNNNYLWNKKAAKCLRDKSNVKTVGDLVQLMEEDTLPCGEEACRKMVSKLLHVLPEIINPMKNTPEKINQQNLDLTPRRVKKNLESQKTVVFNPDIRAKGNPMNHITMFATPVGAKTRRIPRVTKQPAYRPTDARYTYKDGHRPTTMWLTAIAHKSGYENGDARIGEFFGKNDSRNRMLRIPLGEQSKGRAEVVALAGVLDEYPTGDLKVITKSERLFSMFKNETYRLKEDLKWSGAKYEKEWRTLLQILRNRQGVTQVELATFENVQDSQIIKQEENKLREMRSDELEIAQELDPPPTNYEVRGARLTRMTQKLAYELALIRNMIDPVNLIIEQRLTFVKQEVERVTTYRPTSKMIWTSIEKISPPRVSDFVWKIATDRLKCGPWFARIPGWEDKQYCACDPDQSETIEHVMYECERNHAKKVWARIGSLWEQATKTPFIAPNTGILVGIETIKIKGRNTKMYRKLVTIGSWAIWKKRNERIFQKRKTTLKEVLALVGDLIADQIELDLDWSKDQRVKAKQIKISHNVLDTWGGGEVFVKESEDKDTRLCENIRVKIANTFLSNTE